MVRVLKQYDPAIIAAELINQLLGYEYLVDGEFVAGAARYPQRKVGIATHIITSVCMVVFSDRVKISEDISQHADRLMHKIPVQLRCTAPAVDDISAHTYTHAGTHTIRTTLSESGVVVYSRTMPHRDQSRFTVVCLPLEEFTGELSTEFPTASIAKYICGVYVDEWDALSVSGLVWDFPPSIFRHNTASHEQTSLTLCAGPNPLAVHMSIIQNNYTTMRAQLNKPVREGKLEWFTFDAPIVAADSKHRSDKVCARCKDVLYGDVYVLYDHRTVQAIALHPICLHMSPAECAVEDDFTHIFRVHYNDIVPPDEVSAQAFIGIKRIEHVRIEGTMVYYLIGDKYVWFHRTVDAQYRGCYLPDVRNRTLLVGLRLIMSGA